MAENSLLLDYHLLKAGTGGRTGEDVSLENQFRMSPMKGQNKEKRKKYVPIHSGG